ncbi:hypothetical protein K443DRAFT_15509 [Laccaria amethystina LaAM-08-1]|uniref:Uncharacterized protein n=1 Tax=Laccaria amethystina LaAM-08-1 TaxID=1095629 RepID=A0A0C9X0L9_9AGAR|nr:hypothetical protein K443DRAFT_15509 [Laccaria amethystina LaAM-08-1]
MPRATTTTTAMVVVPHKPRHHQSTDVACQRSIRACHVDNDSQDDERDPAAADFEDQPMKERGKGGKGATGGWGNKGPAAARCVVYTIDGKRAIDRVLSPPHFEPTDPLLQDNRATMDEQQPPMEDEHARTVGTPPPTRGQRPPPRLDDEPHTVDGRQPPTNGGSKPPRSTTTHTSETAMTPCAWTMATACSRTMTPPLTDNDDPTHPQTAIAHRRHDPTCRKRRPPLTDDTPHNANVNPQES